PWPCPPWHASRAMVCRLRAPVLFPLLFSLFHGPAPTEIYTLSLHDALPIYQQRDRFCCPGRAARIERFQDAMCGQRDMSDRSKRDRKSTRLNSSHGSISYAVFCLKEKERGVGELIDDNNAVARQVKARERRQ